jgi:hypothetical protein
MGHKNVFMFPVTTWNRTFSFHVIVPSRKNNLKLTADPCGIFEGIKPEHSADMTDDLEAEAFLFHYIDK